MDDTHYREYLTCQAKGLKREAKAAIARFIASFDNDTERTEWTHRFLASHCFGDAVRGELYEKIIFPVLLEAVKQGSPSGYFGMAATHQAHYRATRLGETLASYCCPVELDLLRECKRIDPTYHCSWSAAIKHTLVAKNVRSRPQLPSSAAVTLPIPVSCWAIAPVCCEILRRRMRRQAVGSAIVEHGSYHLAAPHPNPRPVQVQRTGRGD